MIEQIQKFSGGGTSKQRLREAEAAYRSAYAGATDEARAEAEALVQTGKNYTSTNPMTGKQSRLEQTEIYEEAIRILQGQERSPITMSTSRAISDFYSANKRRTSSSDNNSRSSEGGSGIRMYYNYSPLKGLGVTNEDDTLETRVAGLARTLLANLDGAIKAHSKRDIVKGLDMALDYTTPRATLLQVIEGLGNNTMTGRDAYKKIGAIAGQLGITDADRDTWENYFGTLDDLEPWEVNYNKLKGKKYKDVDLSTYGQWIADAATANGLKFMLDDNNNIRAFDKNYNEYTGGELTLYNDNWTDAANNGHAIIIDAQGNVHLGNVNTLTGGKQNNLYKQYTKARTQNTSARSGLWREHDYDQIYSQTENPMFSQVSAYRNQRKFKAIDVSSLFDTDGDVLAVQGNGNQSALTDGNGNIIFNDATKFYVWEGDKIVEKTWQQMKQFYNHDTVEELEQMGPLGQAGSTLRDASGSITGEEDLAGRTAWGRVLGGAAVGGTAGAIVGGGIGSIPGWIIGAVGGALGGALEYGFLDDINEDPSTFVKLVLDATANPDGKIDSKYHITGVGTNSEFLHNIDWQNKSKDYLIYIYKYLEDHPAVIDSLSKEQRNQLHLLFSKYKNGGLITKAAKGTVISATGEDITNQVYGPKSAYHHLREKNQSYDKSQKEASERGFKSVHAMQANDEEVFGGDLKMTTADSMRLLTMAQDVASIVASFVPGAGTGVAAGLGVTSTATDLVADILDPAVSGGQVAKNLAVNAGFAALGMVPGAKMGKVAKNIIKWAPRIISMAATAGIVLDESTQKTFSKIGDGSTHFTREDWKNISHVLSALAGTVKMGKGMYDGHKIKKSIIAKDNVELDGVKVKTATGEEVAMEIPKKTAQDIDAKLKKAKTMEESENILKSQKTSSGERMFTDEQVAAAIKQTTKEGAEPKAGDFKLVSTKKGSDDIDDVSYSKLREVWEQDAAVLQKQAQTKEGQAAIRFANKFGGGAYGAQQRAILGNSKVDNEKFINDYLGYDGWYNPMIDYRGIRNKAAGYSNPTNTGGDAPAPVSTPKYPTNITQDGVQARPRQSAVYPGQDADGVTPSSQAVVPYTGQRPVEDVVLRQRAQQGSQPKVEQNADIVPASAAVAQQNVVQQVRPLMAQIAELYRQGIYGSQKEYDILVDIISIYKKSGRPVPQQFMEYLAHLSNASGITRQVSANKNGGMLKYTHLRK